MTVKQNLGFEITQMLLDGHNQELKEKEGKFFKEFDKVFSILHEIGYKAIEFENLLYDYLDAVKREYYIAGEEVSNIVEKAEIRRTIEELTA